MSEPQTPAATAAPAVPSPPAATPAAPIAAPVAAAPAVTDENPPWLKGRLEQAKTAALAELGITDPAKAKEVIAAAAKAEEDAKTAAQKLGETSKTLETEKARAARLDGVVKDHATRAMSALTDAQREQVRKAAPDADPAEQLRLIDVFFPAGTAAAAAPVATPAAATPPAPAKPAPASTAPAPTAPPGGTVSTPDHKAVHAQLEKANPFAAANYAMEHLAEVFPEPARQ